MVTMFFSEESLHIVPCRCKFSGMVRSQCSSIHVSSLRLQPRSTCTLPRHLPRARQHLELVHPWRRAHPCWEPQHLCPPHSTTTRRHTWTRLICTTVCHRPTLPWTALRVSCMRHLHTPRHPATNLLKWVQFLRRSGWALLSDQIFCLECVTWNACLLY
jgi:hypothetical protein